MQYTIEKPYKMVTKNTKTFIEIFNFCRAIFEKAVFLKNGYGKQEMWATPNHIVFIFHKIKWGNFAENFIQKCW